MVNFGTKCALALLGIVVPFCASANIIQVDGLQFLFGTASDGGIEQTYISGNGAPINLDTNTTDFFIADGASVGGASASGEQKVALNNGLLTSSSETIAQADYDGIPGDPPAFTTFGSHSTLIILTADLGAPNTYFSFDYNFDVDIDGTNTTANWLGAVSLGDSVDEFRYLDEFYDLFAVSDFDGSFSGTVDGFSVLDHITIVLDSQMSGGGADSFEQAYTLTGMHGFNFTLSTIPPDVEVPTPGGIVFLFAACILGLRQVRVY